MFRQFTCLKTILSTMSSLRAFCISIVINYPAICNIWQLGCAEKALSLKETFEARVEHLCILQCASKGNMYMRLIDMWGLTSQNLHMIMRDAVVEGSGNFDHLGFFNAHPNLRTQAYNISASIEKAAATAGIRYHDLRVSSRDLSPYTTAAQLLHERHQ